jgi:hypothetical protein
MMKNVLALMMKKSTMSNHLKTLLCLGLIVSAYLIGAWLERLDAELWRITLARHCASNITTDRYLSFGLDGFVCFSQNSETKRISKTILVLDGI